MNETVPAQIGNYIPRQLLAMGAHAQVWQATGPRGEVALKIARGKDANQALIREAEILSGARHPNLVELVEADPAGAWIALQRVPGSTIDQWAQGQPLQQVIHVTLQLIDVLEHLHRRRIVHGDVKPTNVIVDPSDDAKLIDLGIATRPGDEVEGFRGTLGYAAPELLSGKPPTPATDLYGLGALLYTCLTGRTPFVAPDPAALTYLPLVSLPPPPAAFRPDLPSTLNQLLLALLARDPSRRPTDLDRVRHTLRRCVQHKPATPLLGMLETREALRRAVVGAADGEARVVILYGAPGSGRRTLIAEAVEYARREGLPYLKGTDPAGAASSLRRSPRPAVLVMRAGHKGARVLAERVLREALQCLLLLHADRPVPRLSEAGAIQLTPAPLAPLDVQRLAGLSGADEDLAETWWRESMGLPIAVRGRITAWRRRNGLPVEPSSELPADSRRIYEALRGKPRMQCELSQLASELSLGEHALLDHCEVLFAEELIEPQQDGFVLAVIRSREP